MCGPKLSRVCKLHLRGHFSTGFVWQHPYSSQWNLVLPCMASVPVILDFIVMECPPVVKSSTEMFPCHWPLTDVALSVFCHAATLQHLIIWKIWAGRSVSQAMFWIGMNKSHVFDRFFCCWFTQVVVSTPRAADRSLTDRQCRRACHCWQPKARSLWKAQRERVSIGMETQV